MWLTKLPTLFRLLERFKFFTVFYHLSDLKSREDLIRAIIEKLDYSTCVGVLDHTEISSRLTALLLRRLSSAMVTQG